MAHALTDSADKLTLVDEAQKVYERSLRQNSAQVELWQNYLQFSMQHHSPENGFPDGETLTRSLFERAIKNIGQHMKAG